MISESIETKIMNCVDKEFLISHAMDLVNIPSPTGKEADIALFLKEIYEDLGLMTIIQEVEENRYNVIGTLKGKDVGPTLMFNGHLDTSFTGDEELFKDVQAFKPKAYIEDGWIYGLGIYNMKGALAAYTAAVKAIIESNIELKGDIVIAGVVGEIETAPVNQYQGPQYRGYGRGTHYLVTHGITADMCILGEPTSSQVVLGHFGTSWVKLHIKGDLYHTAFSRGKDNAILQMKEFINYIEDWIQQYEKMNKYKSRLPEVNIASIEGGWPWRASRTPGFCNLYLDVRFPPSYNPIFVKRELERVVEKFKINNPSVEIEVDLYVTVPGAEISSNEYLVKSIESTHRKVYGKSPNYYVESWTSDAATLTKYGVVAVNYGPSGPVRDMTKSEELPAFSTKLGEHLDINDLFNITKSYALIATDICAKTIEELGIKR